MNNTYIYDIEIIGGNFFSISFIDINTKEIFQCYKLNNIEYNLDKLNDYIYDTLLIGYNNHSYDDILITYIKQWNEVNTQELYALSNAIIDHQKTGIPLWKHEAISFYMQGNIAIDLMKILAFDKLKVGLKQCAVNLHHPLIQDLPFHPSQIVTEDMVKTILDYNKNDVLITYNLYNHIKDLIDLRCSISTEYDIDAKNASKTYIGKEILNKYYSKYTGLNYTDFKDLRTRKSMIKLSDCILPNIKFTTSVFQRMLEYFKSQLVYSIEDSINYKVIYNGKGYQMGFGGLHSIDRAAIYLNDKDNCIIDADVDSFYPNIMIGYGIKPEHCNNKFIKVLSEITTRRLKAKRNKDIVTSETLKITVNSIFGLLNFENYWLYDPQAALSVTINGQLFLLMLIELLEINNFNVISANTDGVTCLFPKSRYEEYKKLCNEWEENTNFKLSFSEYLKYIRRDINNYTVLKKDKSIKTKGIFVEEQLLEKGYNTSIIPKALNNYFLYNIPIQETINTSKNIFDFCLSEKSGSQFKMELHYIEGVNKKIRLLQKTNRYFIAKKGGTFIKRKQDDSIYNMQLGWQVYILNDYKEDKLQEYLNNIDNRFYISECNKIIETIEDKQLKLW